MRKPIRTPSCRGLFLVFCLASLAGCATNYPGGVHPTNQHQEWSFSGSNVTYLPAASAEAIADAAPGAIVNVDESPWGTNTRVSILDYYFAASGKRCIRAAIESDSQSSQRVNLCPYGDKQWGATRALAGDTGKRGNL